MKSKFNDEVRGALLQGLRSGLSLHDACLRVDVTDKTVESWLTRGRREDATPYAAFVVAVDEARAAAKASAMDEVEFAAHLNRAVRAGSVQAMKLWWEVHRASNDKPAEQPVDPFAEVDELAKRRVS